MPVIGWLHCIKLLSIPRSLLITSFSMPLDLALAAANQPCSKALRWLQIAIKPDAPMPGKTEPRVPGCKQHWLLEKLGPTCPSSPGPEVRGGHQLLPPLPWKGLEDFGVVLRSRSLHGFGAISGKINTCHE